MFNTTLRMCSKVWQAIVNPTIRLQGDFPWGAGKMAKEYAVSFLLYIAGSFAPILVFIAGLLFLKRFNEPLLGSLLGANQENSMTVVVAMTIMSFLCGFGLQVWYVARSLRADGLSLRTLLALNLDALNGSWWAATWRAGLTVVLAITATQLVHLLPFLPEPKQDTAQFISSLSGWQLVAVAWLVAIAAPVLEEIVFRGFLFNMLRTQLKRGFAGRLLGGQNGADWAASILSAAMFAAAHLQPSALPGLFIFGLLLAQLYRRSGSLVCPIIAHAINNSLAVVLLIASQLH